MARKARPRQDLLPRISVRENNPLTARTIQKHDVRENNPPTTPGATPAIPGQSEIDHRGNSTNHPNPDHISINNQHCRKSSANHPDHSETPPSCPGGVILRPERRFPGHPEFIIFRPWSPEKLPPRTSSTENRCPRKKSADHRDDPETLLGYPSDDGDARASILRTSQIHYFRDHGRPKLCMLFFLGAGTATGTIEGRNVNILSNPRWVGVPCLVC